MPKLWGTVRVLLPLQRMGGDARQLARWLGLLAHSASHSPMLLPVVWYAAACRASSCGAVCPQFLALGVNLKLFPTGGVPFLAALAFHGGLAAILLLYFAFWVEVSLHL